MSSADDSCSSSGDDFVEFLDAELNEDSDSIADTNETSNEKEEDNNESDYDLDLDRVKRRKVGSQSIILDQRSSSPQGERAEALRDICQHPGDYLGMCVRCGENVHKVSGVRLGYINENMTFSKDEITRLRGNDLKKLLRKKKLYLILDLDHTLLNSTMLFDMSAKENYLKHQGDDFPDTLKTSLFRLDRLQMMTKLRPFVHTFLKEASNLFEMQIYTMGERPYALEMAKLLDPGDIYFNSRIIAQGDCTEKYQKGLDVVLGSESAILILDDTEAVWGKHKENLILMEPYHFFASSCKKFNCESLSELKSDESEIGGALARVLKILQRIHNLFFDQELNDSLENRDVRQVLKTVRQEVLKGCKIVFSRVFPTTYLASNQSLWKMAEQLGATCSNEVDASVTHVVSMDAGTEKSRWALQENKFLIHPRWIEASSYLWQKQPEDNFPVQSQAKNK